MAPIDADPTTGKFLRVARSIRVMTHFPVQRRISILCLISGAMFISLFSTAAFSQTGPAQSAIKVGTIKDYPGTGLMTGCGNLYFFNAGAKMTDTTFVFLARGDGSNAWMNLDGRDVRLRQIKSASRGQQPRGYFYRFGQTRISVVIENVGPKADGTETEHMYKMTITVRKGGAARIVHAVGDSDC